MSPNSPVKGQDLAAVLNRINTLVQTNESEIGADDDIYKDIPVLTEVYQAEAYQGITPAAQANLEAFPALNSLAQEMLAGEQPLSEELAERFLSEMKPYINKAIKVAVLEESVKAEKLLTSKLEQEILVLLKDRLTKTLK